jgi:Zn-dependent protease with chaperone function
MIVLLISIFAALSGCIEAILYARRAAESFTFNEHVLFGLQRASVLLLVLVAALLPGYVGTKASACLELVPGLLLFPLAHDEAYNFTRLWLSARAELTADAAGADAAAWHVARALYVYGYQSPTTTARTDFNGKERTWLALGALVLWAAGAYFLFCK